MVKNCGAVRRMGVGEGGGEVGPLGIAFDH